MWDIDTPDGMEAAIEWTHEFLQLGKDQFKWAVPRSEAIYEIDKPNQTVTRTKSDEAIDRVFREMGWKVQNG